MGGHACEVNRVSPATGLAVGGVVLLLRRLHCLLIQRGFVVSVMSSGWHQHLNSNQADSSRFNITTIIKIIKPKLTSWTDIPVMALVSPSSCIINCCPLRGIGADRETILVEIILTSRNENEWR